MGLFSILFGIGSAINNHAKKSDLDQEDLSMLSESEKEEVKKGNYSSFNFDTDDTTDEDDYYHEDDD